MSFLMLLVMIAILVKVSGRGGGSSRQAIQARMRDFEDHVLDRLDGLEIAVRNLTERLHDVESQAPQIEPTSDHGDESQALPPTPTEPES